MNLNYALKRCSGHLFSPSNTQQPLNPLKIMDYPFTYQKVNFLLHIKLAISIKALVRMCKNSEIIAYLWGLNTSGVTSHLRHSYFILNHSL